MTEKPPVMLIFLALLLLLAPSFQVSLAKQLPLEEQSIAMGTIPCTNDPPDTLKRSDFPEGFVFGTATSAFQVEGAAHEGGRGLCTWDVWASIKGKIRDGSTPDYAVDQYHKYEEDVELLSDLNVDAYRFSIAWSRVLPDGYGPPNEEGIAYYNHLIDALLKKGITPYATLFHWDLPQTLLDDMGGWLNRKIVDHFLLFAETCFAAFGDRVKHWVTINEPRMFSAHSYFEGIAPPGRTSAADLEPYICAHHLLLAHGAAVQSYRTKFKESQAGLIGLALDNFFAVPLQDTPEDWEAAERHNLFVMGWFLDPIYFGAYPEVMRKNVGWRLPTFSADDIALVRGSLDFIGINHYTSRWATPGPGPRPNSPNNSMDTDMHVTVYSEYNATLIGPRACSSWLYMYPKGLYAVLTWTWARYKVPMIITENGMDYPGSLSMEDNLRDTGRVQYYIDYLREALKAVGEGVDVRGFFAWSFLDNFEWSAGFTARFGLVYVDFQDKDQKRSVKESGRWYKQLLQKDPDPERLESA